jgi:predicted enzyme related to lactoylglutathione lyase
VDGGRLLIAKAANDTQAAIIGKQAGGRVGFFAHTDDFAGTHGRLSDAGVLFHEQPRHEAYGTVAVFSDPFGNRWDLIEPKVPGQ